MSRAFVYVVRFPATAPVWMLQRTPPQRAINKHLPPPRPIPTGSPSTAPTNVAVSSLENHLAQLVQQNKKSEEERLKLKEKLDELSVEAKANRENLLLLRERYKMEKTEWRIGCDAVSGFWLVPEARHADLWLKASSRTQCLSFTD